PGIIGNRNIARLATPSLSGAVRVYRSLELENDHQLIGAAARDHGGPPRHAERRALTTHQDRARRRIGAGCNGEARFLRRIRQRYRVVMMREGVAKSSPDLRAEGALRVTVQPSQLGWCTALIVVFAR